MSIPLLRQIKIHCYNTLYESYFIHTFLNVLLCVFHESTARKKSLLCHSQLHLLHPPLKMKDEGLYVGRKTAPQTGIFEIAISKLRELIL